MPEPTCESTFPRLTEEQVKRLDVPGPRYTSYPTVPEWSEEFGPEAYAETLAQAGRAKPDEPLSVYVHIPFCEAMCLYCGCNVVIADDTTAADGYLTTVGREIELAAERLGPRRTLSRIHWGGGTPTFLSTDQMRRLWASILQSFQLLEGAEVALEADPVVTTPDQVALLAELGFNRLSLGVQDFSPEVQEAVKRHQRFDRTAELVAHARRVGFQSINLDLIYGLPKQRLETWQRTLDLVLEIRPERLAIFSFAYVPKVRPHQRKLEEDALPGGALKLELRRQAHEHLVAAGYRPIGMDHFALPHDELAQAQASRTLWRDFQGYTVRAAADTVAFGITGISDVHDSFAQTVRSRTRYRDAIGSGRFATERGLRLDEDDRTRRAIITQLMCNFWVDLEAGAGDRFATELEELRRLESEGLLRLDGTELSLTPMGRVFVRNVAMVFDSRLRRRSTDSRPTFSRTI